MQAHTQRNRLDSHAKMQVAFVADSLCTHMQEMLLWHTLCVPAHAARSTEKHMPSSQALSHMHGRDGRGIHSACLRT